MDKINENEPYIKFKNKTVIPDTQVPVCFFEGSLHGIVGRGVSMA